MDGKEKDSVMQAFLNGELDILVATTVVESGTDVPEASVMIIEQVKQFGLAQLHWMRGRVGRGKTDSSCLQLYREPLCRLAQQRALLMRETEDSFRRGSDELPGTQQDCRPLVRLVHPHLHRQLLDEAQKEAGFILEENFELKGKRGDSLRVLLYLFEREEAIRYCRSG